MPYDNPKQPVAIFMDLMRRRGEAAARAFASKHRADMSKGRKDKKRTRSYSARSRP